MGFPTGITGMALMARAYNQAQKFGVEMAIPDDVIALDPASYPYDGRFMLNLSDGECASARSIVIASGARYAPTTDRVRPAAGHGGFRQCIRGVRHAKLRWFCATLRICFVVERRNAGRQRADGGTGLPGDDNDNEVLSGVSCATFGQIASLAAPRTASFASPIQDCQAKVATTPAIKINRKRMNATSRDRERLTGTAGGSSARARGGSFRGFPTRVGAFAFWATTDSSDFEEVNHIEID